MRLLTGRVAAGRPAFCMPGLLGNPQPLAGCVIRQDVRSSGPCKQLQRRGGRESESRGSRVLAPSPGLAERGGGGWGLMWAPACTGLHPGHLRPPTESDIRLDQTGSGPPLELLL